MSSAELVSTAKEDTVSSTITSPGLTHDAASSATSYSPDPHAVSMEEALSYYAGLPSKPVLVYRTGKEPWSPPKGPGASRHLKQLWPVFGHPIVKVWNDDLAWKVVTIMDTHQIRPTTIDIIRFKKVIEDEDVENEDDEEGKAKKEVVGPVTIWVGVSPGTTSATAAHGAAQDILALLKDHEITDVDVDFRESVVIFGPHRGI